MYVDDVNVHAMYIDDVNVHAMYIDDVRMYMLCTLLSHHII